jgi:two-component system OmpR family sensor kinase
VNPALVEAGPDSTPPRRRLWLRSLTSRLVAGVVALVIVVVAAIGGATYYFLRAYLYNRLDQQVQSSAQSNAAFMDRCLKSGRYLAPGGCSSGGPPPPAREWIAILNLPANLPIQFSGPNISALSLSSGDRRALLQNPGEILTVYSGGAELRVAAQPEAGLVVVTGLSTREVHTTLRRLILLEVVIGAAAVVVAAVITSWGVRRGLRNLYRVTSTAQEVAAELSPTGAGLDRRVPVVEEGTEIGQLAESMNTLLAAVETQFAARLEIEHRLRQFLADASHELRTPLTSIRGYAELARMQRAAQGGTTAENADSNVDGSADNLGRIEAEGTRMSRLVDDLLLLARGEANGAVPAEHHELVDVGAVLEEVVDSSRAAFPEREIVRHAEPLPAVVGDRDQLLRAVRNLVANAAVHTDPARPIYVGGRPEAGGVLVTVVDGGPGLPPEQAAHVFERFWRADKARSRARGGSGLGMSIVAAIVHAHGGSVRFDSSVQTGSTVTMWLPAAR